MPKLWVPDWHVSPDFAFPRSYTWGIAIGWWQANVIQSGNPLVLQEVPFGGYRFYVRFFDWFWNWNSNRATAESPIEDIYALAPGSSVPISAGSVAVNWGIDNTTTHKPVYVLANQPSDEHYYFFPLPGAPPGYWVPPFPS